MMGKVTIIKDNYRLVVWPISNTAMTVGVSKADCENVRDEILRHVDWIDKVEIVCDGLKVKTKLEHYPLYVDLKDVEVDGEQYEIRLTVKQKKGEKAETKDTP